MARSGGPTSAAEGADDDVEAVRLAHFADGVFCPILGPRRLSKEGEDHGSFEGFGGSREDGSTRKSRFSEE
jgi:hypothetical protein